MNLYQYLTHIQARRPFNAPRFDKLLRAKTSYQLRDIGEAVFVSRNKYHFTVTNPELLNTLITQFTPANTRTEAAVRLGDSHQAATEFMYLTAKDVHGHWQVFGAHGQDVTPLLNSDTARETEHYDNVILIENADCFTYFQRFLAAMDIAPATIDNSLIVWSMGKAVLHPHIKTTLNRYQNVYTCQDYDEAGMQIFAHLQQHLSTKVHFVLPKPDILSQLHQFAHKTPQDGATLLNAIALSREHGWNALANILTQTRMFIEQEAFLHEPHEPQGEHIG